MNLSVGPAFATGTNLNFDDDDAEDESCSEECLGDDTPGVGPWVHEFDD